MKQTHGCLINEQLFNSVHPNENSSRLFSVLSSRVSHTNQLQQDPGYSVAPVLLLTQKPYPADVQRGEKSLKIDTRN